MATNTDAIAASFSFFYDMTGKSVIHVGAGGGQLIGYARKVRSVLVVDPDPAAVSKLRTAILELGLGDRFSIVQEEFSSVSARADVVFFEFCLHEIDDPDGALFHARSLAPDILVLDHLPESRWAWYACEEENAARSWAALRRLRILREASFTVTPHFDTYARLVSKFGGLGERAMARLGEFSRQNDIAIPMDYAIALVRNDAAGLRTSS